MKIEQRYTLDDNTIAVEQCNFYNLTIFYSWYDEANIGGRYTVAVWRTKSLRDMKPSDWDQMDYPNNINA